VLRSSTPFPYTTLFRSAEERGWQLSMQGRKLYWVPRSLRKSAAVAEVARRTEADTVAAAGDSLLDIDLLEHADIGIAARHGELRSEEHTSELQSRSDLV